MQTKEIKPITAICFSCQTNLSGLSRYVRVKARELYQSALKNNMEITGPVYWFYHGMDGNPETMFILEICLPVQASEFSDEQFEIMQLPVFKCLSATYCGDWMGMPDIYGELINHALNSGYQLTGTSREVYINMDFETPENNITEVQIGIN
ncbi:MAG: GyrI-like domain-containing protein [Bacteroidota bacterium]|nr:GyrI-like domain-containing protein [Bacteroidota bacterium]